MYAKKKYFFIFLHVLILLLTIACSKGIRKVQNFNKSEGSTNSDLKILVISDLNSSYGSTTYSAEVNGIVDQIPKLSPSLILVPGDMIAGQKTAISDETMNAMWASFDSIVFKPVRSHNIPFAFTFGNHDASPGFVRDRKIAAEFWASRKSKTGLNYQDANHYPFYFSYVHHNIFIISWDAAAAKIDSEVYDWMEKELQSPAARNASIRILTGHLPLFAIVESKNKTGEVLAEPMQALNFFKKHNIDLYISGHQHAYYPAQKNGIRFLNSGCIGDGPRALMGSVQAPVKTYTVINVPAQKSRKFSYQTYKAGDHSLINHENLPDSIIGFNGNSYLDQ